jgi:hypothetical protein
MILFVISLLALIYSLVSQTIKAIVYLKTPAYKKTAQYKRFENELKKLIN